MPTYEYQCTKCNKQFEYFQSIKDAPKSTCEACGGELTKLLSGGTGLIFKGSGFYITDYKPSGSGKSGEGKSETPPAKSGAAPKSESAATSTPAASKKE